MIQLKFINYDGLKVHLFNYYIPHKLNGFYTPGLLKRLESYISVMRNLIKIPDKEY